VLAAASQSCWLLAALSDATNCNAEAAI